MNAHLNAQVDGEGWFGLPDEFEEYGMYAKLRRWPLRREGWRRPFTKTDGFRRGRATPTMLLHPETQVRAVVHGDDFTFAEKDLELKKIKSKICERYDVKVRGILGSGRRDVQEIEILRWTEQGLGYESGDKHRQVLLRDLGLNDDTKTGNSAAMEELSKDEDEEILGEEAKQFRSLAAMTKCMSLDRSGVQYAAKV